MSFFKSFQSGKCYTPPVFSISLGSVVTFLRGNLLLFLSFWLVLTWCLIDEMFSNRNPPKCHFSESKLGTFSTASSKMHGKRFPFSGIWKTPVDQIQSNHIQIDIAIIYSIRHSLPCHNHLRIKS